MCKYKILVKVFLNRQNVIGDILKYDFKLNYIIELQ